MSALEAPIAERIEMRRVFEQLVNTERTSKALKVFLAVDLLTLLVLAVTILCQSTILHSGT